MTQLARDPSAPRLVFVDTEATGLDHRVHQLTEVAWILREPDGTEVTRRFVPEHTLDGAEGKALEITRYHELLADEPRTPDAEWIDVLLGDTEGAVLVGRRARLRRAAPPPGVPADRFARRTGTTISSTSGRSRCRCSLQPLRSPAVSPRCASRSASPTIPSARTAPSTTHSRRCAASTRCGSASERCGPRASRCPSRSAGPRPPGENGNGAADAAATADAASDSGEAGAAEQPEAEQVQRG